MFRNACVMLSLFSEGHGRRTRSVLDGHASGLEELPTHLQVAQPKLKAHLETVESDLRSRTATESIHWRSIALALLSTPSLQAFNPACAAPGHALDHLRPNAWRDRTNMPAKRLASSRSRVGSVQMELGFQVPEWWSILPTVLFFGTLLSIRSRQGVASEKRQIRDAAGEVYRRAKAAQLGGKVKEQDIALARSLFRKTAMEYEAEVTTQVPFTDLEFRLFTRPNSKEMNRALADIGLQRKGWSRQLMRKHGEGEPEVEDPLRFFWILSSGLVIGLALPLIGLSLVDPLVLEASDAAIASNNKLLASMDTDQAINAFGRPAVEFAQASFAPKFTAAVDAEDFLQKASGGPDVPTTQAVASPPLTPPALASGLDVPSTQGVASPPLTQQSLEDIEEARTRGLDATRGWISGPTPSQKAP